MDSLGCTWNKCHFCVHNHIQPGYQKRAVDDVISEMRAMTAQGIALFRFAGSETPPEFGAEIARAMLDRGIVAEYTIGMRAVRDAVCPDMAESIAKSFVTQIRAGLRAVFIGGESGNDTVNDAVMNKGITRMDIIHTIKGIREGERRAGRKISVSLALIYPVPLTADVRQEDVFRDNLSLLDECRPDAVMITPPGPFKHSAWNRRAKEFGFSLGKDFIRDLMRYEYVLYKPLTMWPEIAVSLDGVGFKDLARESQRLRRTVESSLGIPTDLSDEHFLMMECANINTAEQIAAFKRSVAVSLVSCDYSYIDMIAARVDDRSAALAALN
jgi:hypothetical protein